MSTRHAPAARRSTPPGWPCAQACTPELLPGTIVGEGRFVVGALLGRGGMATVYRSHDRRLGRETALKVMLGDPARHRSRAARFEHEAGLLARLPVHPGLVRLLHAGRLPELAARPFLAVELVHGPTLAFRLATHLRMPARESVALGLGMARALVVVHGAGVVHRDLTARNVMLHQHAEREGHPARATEREGTRPILVDFGVAAAIEREPGAPRLTRPDQRPGTVTAMAPEQYLGRPAHPAMDVYALGRLLYEMLTAEDPHATLSHAELLERHHQGIRVAPRLVGREDVGPIELRALVDACLEREPARRPTAHDVAAALHAVARTLERGATVLPFAGGPQRLTARAGLTPRPASPWRRAGSRLGASQGEHEGWMAWWSPMLAVGVVGVVGVVLGLAVGWPRSAPVAAIAEAHAPEPVIAAWPATLVPVMPVARPEPPPALPRTAAVADRLPRSTTSPPRAAASRGPAPALACDEPRTRAMVAARRWDWPEVLRATADRTCWPDAAERLRLRLTAWIEQQRFDACASEGAHVREPALVRLVERCRQRLRPAVAAPGGGSP